MGTQVLPRFVFVFPLILAVGGLAQYAGGDEESVDIFQSSFEEAADENYDGWPDGWTRRRGKGYPEFVKIAIADDGPATNGATDDVGAGRGRVLRIDLDGGSATLYSPPVAVNKDFSYLLSALARTEKLRHNLASCSITFLDADKHPLATHTSESLRDAPAWKSLQVGPVIPSDQATWAVVGLHLRATGKTDLAGAALFDELRLTRLPRISLELSGEHHLYADPAQVEATCRVSGLSNREPRIHFELRDVMGRQVTAADLQLEVAKMPPRGVDKEEYLAGIATWKPQVPGWGFYSLSISLPSAAGNSIERTTTLAVLRPQANTRQGEFGWTLPRGEQSHSLKSLVGLLSQMGVSWVKFPVWYHADDQARANELAWFAERLGRQGIELVGMLDQPPAAVREQLGGRSQVPAASVFVEPALWEPVVDPVMSRLGLKVKWWQLGADNDLGYVGYPGLENRVADIRKRLERFGQEIQICLPWNATVETPPAKVAPWGALSQWSEPAFTAAELTEYLAGTPAPGVKRWLILEPLARSRYSLETRARDLVGRMLTAKMQRADAVFIPDPFAREHGILNPNGTPGELLLPWRTTAHMISGAEYLGSLDLPGGSHNRLFARGGQAVLVVWSDKPTRETLYLGDDLRQVDIWGQESIPRQEGHEQTLDVTATPAFITGVNLAIAKWRLAFAFDTPELASVFGRDQSATFRFRNFFEQGVGGEISLITPAVWETTPGKFHFKAATGEEVTQSFLVLLKPDANTGDQPVRIDFDVTADRNYKFSVYRRLRVGMGDILLSLTTRLNDEGVLVVDQQLTNTTDRPVSFNCYLFVPEQRRQRSQVFEQGRGRVSRTYYLPDGEDLIGQTIWLRAEEINGPRLLNCHVVVER